MKVYISNYRDHWYSPYTWIDNVFFWTDWSKCHRDKTLYKLDNEYVERPEWADKFADFLTPVSIAIQKILDTIHPPIRYVKIDRWDTWSMDHTLSHIILPMLKQLHETKHGAPGVDDDDVPDELKSTSAPPKENEWDTDDNHFKRWDWVLNEMIFAFEHTVDESWQEEYRSGDIDFKFVPVDKDGNEVAKGESNFSKMVDGPNHTWKCDYDGIAKVEERMANGFRLFGKYYRSLWD